MNYLPTIPDFFWILGSIAAFALAGWGYMETKRKREKRRQTNTDIRNAIVRSGLDYYGVGRINGETNKSSIVLLGPGEVLPPAEAPFDASKALENGKLAAAEELEKRGIKFEWTGEPTDREKEFTRLQEQRIAHAAKLKARRERRRSKKKDLLRVVRKAPKAKSPAKRKTASARRK